MKLNLSRRLALLEARQDRVAKSMNIIIAADKEDANRQMAVLVADRAAGDGFLCLTGKPFEP